MACVGGRTSATGRRDRTHRAVPWTLWRWSTGHGPRRRIRELARGSRSATYAPDVRRSVLLAVVVLAAAACATAGAGEAASPSPTVPEVTVGAGPETESMLLAHVIGELLEAAAIPAEVDEFADARDTRQAIELGAIDVRPAYTGEAWLEVMGRADPPGDPRTSFARVREFDEGNGLVWVRPVFGREEGVEQRLDVPPANATFAFVVQGPPALDADLTRMSDLARRFAQQPDARLCVDEEFGSRPDGLQAVLDAYRMPYRPEDDRFLGAAPADAVRGVAAGDCIAGLTTTTDGEAWRLGLRPLVDDLEVFPAFVVTAQVTDEVRQRIPGVIAAVGPLPANLTTRMLARWNGEIVGGRPVEEVAADAARELLALAGRPVPTP